MNDDSLVYNDGSDDWLDELEDAIEYMSSGMMIEVGEIFYLEAGIPDYQKHSDLVPDNIIERMQDRAADMVGLEFADIYLNDLDSKDIEEFNKMLNKTVCDYLDKKAGPVNFYLVENTRTLKIKLISDDPFEYVVIDHNFINPKR